MAEIVQMTRSPYRILGLFSNADFAVCKARAEELLALSDTELTQKQYVTDIEKVLGPVPRTRKDVEWAIRELTEETSRLQYAFFWFTYESKNDEIALAQFNDGDSDHAKDVFEKKGNYASVLNSALVAFIQGDAFNTIGNTARVIHDEKFRAQWPAAKDYHPFRLSSLYVRALEKEPKIRALLDLSRYQSDEECDAFLSDILYVRDRVNIAIQNVGAMRSMPVMALKSADRLIETTIEPLHHLKEKLGSQNPFYTHVVNMVVNEAMAMIVANINFLQTCPPGKETLRRESAKAAELLTRLSSFDMSESMRKEIENNEAILGRLRSSIEKTKKGACYIATMAYGSYDHPQVIVLREFRDSVLRPTTLGRQFIAFYYRHSPKLVRLFKDKPLLNRAIRLSLDTFIRLLRFAQTRKNTMR